jgi:hypothetical protein
MKRLIAPIGALAASIGMVLGANAQQLNLPLPNPNCGPVGQMHLNGQHYPTTIEPEFSIWCYTQPASITPTRVAGANDWVDTFDNDAPTIVHFDDHAMGYRVFDALHGPQGSFGVGKFVNMDHWMIDLVDSSQYRLSGGVLVSPDKQFSFENGTLVVEVDAVAGSDGMGGADAFYEIDVSPAAAPTGVIVDPLYGYGNFGMVGAVGCRLERQQDGPHVVCAMYDNSGRDAGGTSVVGQPNGRPGRLWETQGVGTAATAPVVEGGYPGWAIPGTNLHVRDVWRECADNELDIRCRDRFRMEITRTSIRLFVNSYLVMRIEGLYAVNPSTGSDNRIPDSWFNSGVRPYFTSWINAGMHTPARWHWDRIAVNPHNAQGGFAAPSAAPSFCLGDPNNTCASIGGAPAPSTPPTTPPVTAAPPTAVPTSVPTQPAPTSVPTQPAPVVTATPLPPVSTSVLQNVTFDGLAGVDRTLSGEYPAGVIDWSNAPWYLSSAYGKFKTNSISFDGDSPRSAAFRFVTPRRLFSVDAYNGGTTTSRVTLTCDGQSPVKVQLAEGELRTIQTNWSMACTSVGVSSSNGWYTNFDNLQITQ